MRRAVRTILALLVAAASVARSDLSPADECCLFVHSTGRAEALPFWRQLLIAIDRHWPFDACAGFYFSLDADDEAEAALATLLPLLSKPPTLIRRPPLKSKTDESWTGAV